MPALPNVPSVLKVTYQHMVGSDLDAVSRQFLRYSGAAPSVGELGTFATALGAAWGTYCAGLCNASYTLEQVNITDLTSDTSAQTEQTVDVAGSRVGLNMSADVAMVTSYEIARRYRGGHPRGYWPFGSVGDIDSPQEWDGGFVGDCQAGVNDLLIAGEALGWAGAGTITPVTVSYYAGFTAVENPITHRYRNVPNIRAVPVVDNITSTVARTRVASQRRRLEKG